MFQRAIGVIIVLAATVGLAGCGSSSVSAEAFVQSVCRTVGPYEHDLAASSQALDPSRIKTPVQGRAALKKFLQSISGDTGTALSQLQSAGTPKVTGGTTIHTRIIQAFMRLDRALKSAAGRAGSLPTSSDQAFKTAATTLVATVRSSLQTIGPSLSGLKASELRAAAKHAPACVKLDASG